jgi:dTDP-4-dehydrorhamnose reductase
VKVLIAGSCGQVGSALRATRPPGIEILSLTHDDLDICDAAAVDAQIGYFAPDVIINAAAYTAVDKAETDREAARRANELGPLHLARAAQGVNHCRLLHISTDLVFDGENAIPYGPESDVAPLSVYGQTKLDGERRVLEVLRDRATVVRTSWVYDASGCNFVRTMLRLMNERRAVRVVADRIGTPTAAHSVAATLWCLAREKTLSGIFHWSDAGVASWYDFAVAIAEEGAALGVAPRDVEVTPITSEEYPTPAKRPPFSVMDKRATVAALGIRPVHWRQNLRSVLAEVARTQVLVAGGADSSAQTNPGTESARADSAGAEV